MLLNMKSFAVISLTCFLGALLMGATPTSTPTPVGDTSITTATPQATPTPALSSNRID